MNNGNEMRFVINAASATTFKKKEGVNTKL